MNDTTCNVLSTYCPKLITIKGFYFTDLVFYSDIYMYTVYR